MTLNVQAPIVRHLGDGVTTVFPFSFTLYASAQLQVIEVVRATGAETIKTEGAHYSVAISAAPALPGGSVTAGVAPAATVDWVLRRAVPLDQQDHYTQPFLQTVERRFDRVMTTLQDMAAELARTIRVPWGDAALATLPIWSARANGFLKFDATGLATIVAGLLPPTTAVSAFGVTLINVVDAAAARAVLQVPYQDSGGRLLVGLTSSLSVEGTTSIQQLAADGAAASITVLRYTPGGGGAFFRGASARGAVGSPANIQNTDGLAGLVGAGYFDGSYYRGGQFRFVVDGTPGANGIPTAAELYLSPGGGVGEQRAWKTHPDKTLELDGALKLLDDASVDGVATQAQMEAETASKVVTANAVRYSPATVKAWAKFTTVAGAPQIDRSYGLTSLTDHGAGDFTANWTTAFADAHYAFQISGRLGAGAAFVGMENQDNAVRTTTAVRFYCLTSTGTPTDPVVCSITAAGDL